MSEPSTITRQRPAVGEFIIESLPVNTRAHLYGRTWDGLGYWRWETGRRRNYKTFFRFNRFGVPVKVPDIDWPEAWTPLTPVARTPSPQPLRTADLAPPDVAATLEAFNDRLIMALQVHLALPDEMRAMTRIRVYGLVTCAGAGDYAPGMDTRIPPSVARAQQENSERVLVWFARLTPEQQDLCWLRAQRIFAPRHL